MQYKNICSSNDNVYWFQKKCDRFKIALGSGYFLDRGVLKNILGNLDVKWNSGSPGGPNQDIFSPDIVHERPVQENSSVVGVVESLGPLGGSDGGVVSAGGGLFVDLGVGANLKPIETQQSKKSDIGKRVFDGRIGGGSSGIYIKPLDLQFGGGNFGGNTGNTGGNTGTIFEQIGESVHEDVFWMGDPNYNTNLEINISPTPNNTDSNIFFKFDPKIVDEHFVLSMHEFKVVLEIEPYLENRYDWNIYKCRLYIPELSTLLHSLGIKIENVLTSRNFLSLPSSLLKYLVYLDKVKSYLEEYIVSKEKMYYYNFKYNSSVGYNGEKDYCILEQEAIYNYFDKETEVLSNQFGPTILDSIYDRYFVKSFDTRANSEKGTTKNVSIVVDDEQEYDVVDSIYSQKNNMPFGVSFKYPSFYNLYSIILKESELFTFFTTAMYYDFVKRDYKYSYDEACVVDTKNSGAKIVKSRKTFISSWLRAIGFNMVSDLDYNNFGITLYDFGYKGDRYNLHTLEDLSLFEKRVFAIGALERIIDLSIISPLDIFRNKVLESQNFGFISEKEDSSGVVQHRFSSFIVGREYRVLSFFDSQWEFKKLYKHRFSIYNVFEEMEYMYSVPVDGKKYNEDLKAIQFSLLCRRSLSGLFLPYWESNIVVSDNLPVPPEVRVEQYRDIRNRVLFVFNTGLGEWRDKFVILEKRDEEIYKLLLEAGKVDSDGKVLFRSDDHAIAFEVFVTDQNPQSYSDFKKEAVLNNFVDVEGKRYYTSSNSFEYDIEDGKKKFFFFRQIDVHGNVSNPSDIYIISFVNLGDRSVMVLQVEDAKDVFEGRSFYRYSVGVRKYFVLRLKQGLMTNVRKRYKIILLSKKTKRKCEIGTNLFLKIIN